jgi:transcriptional regulator with XRE-family HTH domain
MPEPAPGRGGREPLPGSRFLSDAVAEKVRGYRLLRRLKQDDVANGMRKLRHHTWTRQTVSDVERVQRNLTVDELVGLSIVLELSLNELLDPMPVGGGPPPTLDVGLPVPLPPDIVRHWSTGASIFITSETRDGKPGVRVTAVGHLADQEEERQ